MIKSLKSYYVYIVKCSDNSYYTGVTNNVDGRVWEHNNSTDEAAYTYSRRPIVLKYVESFEDVNVAISREKQIKGWSSNFLLRHPSTMLRMTIGGVLAPN